MPTDMTKYPDNWSEIRSQILKRAGGADNDPRVGAVCEWCGVPNYALRVGDTIAHFAMDSYSAAAEIKRTKIPEASVIVLTIAHVHDPDPMNVSPDNLAALCQRCHNRHDVEMRQQNRIKNERMAQIEAGQLRLL